MNDIVLTIIGIVSLVVIGHMMRAGERKVDETLKQSPYAKEVNEMLHSMGAPRGFDPIEIVTSPFAKRVGSLVIWCIVVAMLAGIILKIWHGG